MGKLIDLTDTLIGEVWKPAPGFEQDYEVSNRGRICSHRKGHTRLLKPILEKWNGYFTVSLFDAKGKMHKVKVHRLVALAFIPNPHGYPCVNHKDEDKTNNHTDNLEWCSKAYNTTYGTSRQRARETLLRKLAEQQ